MQEVWRGQCSAWECDELGHLNVRFYLAKAMECVAGFGIQAGMAESWTQAAFSTLRPRDIHIRFIRECLPGAPLSGHAGVIGLGEDTLRLYVELRHAANGETAAAFRFDLAHISTRTEDSFAWPARLYRRFQDCLIEPPGKTAPRGVNMDVAPGEDASLARALALGATRIGMGVFDQDECGPQGWIRPETILSRVSMSIFNFRKAFPEETASAEPDAPGRIASALLEARLVYRVWPRAGSAYVIQSGIVEAGERTKRLVHWICDPVTGQAWASMEGVAIPMNLETRTALPPNPDARAALDAMAIKGLCV